MFGGAIGSDVGDDVMFALSNMTSPEDAAAIAAMNELQEDWKSTPLPSQKRIFKEFNNGKTKLKARRGDRCFFCKYWGESKTPIGGQEAMGLKEFAKTHYGAMDDIEFVQIMHTRYHMMRNNVNARLRPGEHPLPDMTEMQIYYHFKRHTHDIETKMINRLKMIQEAIEEGSTMMIETTGSGNSRKRRFNSTVVSNLGKLTQMELAYHKCKPSEMTFYNNGKHVSSANMSQGSIILANKQLTALLEEENRRARKRMKR